MASFIDPSKNSRFSVSFGNAQDKNRSYSSIAYNQKPQQTVKTRVTTINKSVAGTKDAYQLDVRDNGDKGLQKYTYTGLRSLKSRTYILTLDQDKQSFTMEPLQSQFRFNLTSTNFKSGEQLIEDHKPINLDEPVEGSSSDEEPGHGDSNAPDELLGNTEAGADPENPFDFRNYLNGLPGVQPKAQQGTSSAMASPRPDSPRAQPPPAKPSARSAPLKQPPKPLRTTKRAPAAKKEVPPPKIQVERRPSTRNVVAPSESPKHDDGDEDGGFTLELDPDTKPKKKSGFLTPSGRGDGPVSLREVYSMSPESHVSHSGGKRKQEPSSFILEDMADEVARRSDDDIDALALDSPPEQHNMHHYEATADHEADADVEMDDEDDDLEGQLVQALEDEDELMEDVAAPEPVRPTVQQQEESESEEE